MRNSNANVHIFLSLLKFSSLKNNRKLSSKKLEIFEFKEKSSLKDFSKILSEEISQIFERKKPKK